MPEGHVIHRLAGDVNARFAGHVVEVSSPQGRFADSAALVDGHILSNAEAWGKHLFINFDSGRLDRIIHIHLGLIGKLRFYRDIPARGQLRLLIRHDDDVAVLTGPQWCRLISPSDRDDVVAKLGPDPLRADADPQIAWEKIRRSRRPIAALLMDQGICAGVGNIYRAEVLFRHGVCPMCPGTQLRQSSFRAMWDDLVELMADGVSTGRIDTVYPEHTPEAMGRPPRIDRHGGEVYVYRRAHQPCFVCGEPVKLTELANRRLYWCGTCQCGQ